MIGAGPWPRPGMGPPQTAKSTTPLPNTPEYRRYPLSGILAGRAEVVA